MKKKRSVYLWMTLIFLLCICCLPAYAQEVDETRSALDFTALLQAVIILASSFITLFLIPWIKNKTSAETQKKITGYVSVAVYAAEQIYGAGNGFEKLKYVENWLKRRQINVDIDTLRALIESEVYKMSNEFAIIDGIIPEKDESEEVEETEVAI